MNKKTLKNSNMELNKIITTNKKQTKTIGKKHKKWKKITS
jgi:hypothetical protein